MLMMSSCWRREVRFGSISDGHVLYDNQPRLLISSVANKLNYAVGLVSHLSISELHVEEEKSDFLMVMCDDQPRTINDA